MDGRGQLPETRTELISALSVWLTSLFEHTSGLSSLGSHGMALGFGRTAVKERGRRDYPATNGSAGGKLPAGNGALRFPAFSASAASLNFATNQA